MTLTATFQPDKDLPIRSVQAANVPDEDEQAVVGNLSELADSADAAPQAAGMPRKHHTADLSRASPQEHHCRPVLAADLLSLWHRGVSVPLNRKKALCW